jgi:hypothetical protein
VKEKADIKEHVEAVKKERVARGVKAPPTYDLTLKTLAKPGPGELVTEESTKAKLNLSQTQMADPEDGDDTPPEPVEDIVLQEAQKILIDYIGLLKGAVVSQR